jgi:PAS domain S-box-containing protein
MSFLKKNQPFYLEQVLNLLTAESHSACIWLSLEKEILYVNESAVQIFGGSSKDLVGKDFSLLCQSQGIEDFFSNYLSKDFNFPITEKISELKIADQISIVMQWNFFPIKSEENTTTSILMIGTDIRKNLQDKNSYLYNIMNNVPHTIFWKNRDSVFLGCNEAFAVSAQLKSPQDIVGLTDYDLPWKKSESDAYRADDQVVMENDQPRLNIEETQTLANGETIILLTSKVPIHDKNGKVNGVLGVYTDITAQKNIDKQLEKGKEDADELKKTTYLLEGARLISGSIAHEIRTPLATIKATIWNIDRTLSILMKEAMESIADEQIEIIKKGFSIINKKVDQSNSIINMLLTKLQSINFESSEFSICSASDCIQDALNEFAVPSQLINKINFKKDFDFKLMGNRILVMHVIMNLLKNAVFYVIKAGKGEITIWLEQHKKHNEIHFKDTGTGIKKQFLPKIFESFFTTESSSGTGVGLAFSKMVMRSHGGEISCKSQEAKYTEFILSFPLTSAGPA